ncbi:short-chain dehydrogenase [Salinibacter sp. 10B]|uniref:SDR family NAD(P)-dependent oxidoreductase n=1 Tax=Salinibacter sp. 10B TaxID=1923971 RepID=UPI000CF419B6|nr:SDR family oxidoreductase [Salinibacter sp. 10B]PQJ33300.1 short-chain dehydrogenase [Salinibacter sp. 10B]
MGKFEEKTVIVTGGASGIGKAISMLFAEENAQVALLDIDVESATETVQEIRQNDGSVTFFECDVSDSEEVHETVDDVVDTYGGLDVLINNAGIAHIGTVEETTEEELDRVYEVNVKGVYNCLKAGVEVMKGDGGGAIVNIASVASHVGIPDRFAYSMSKGAVLTMTYSVARDYVEDGIRCNAVSPARIHTPFVDGFLSENYPGEEEEMFEELSQTQPIGRMGEPEEVAKLCLYLSSDDAGFITGSSMPIDGGFMSLKD